MAGVDIRSAILEQGQLLAHLRHEGKIDIDDGQAFLIAEIGERPPERVDGHAMTGVNIADLVRGNLMIA
jgi:hypothetical protein